MHCTHKTARQQPRINYETTDALIICEASDLRSILTIEPAEMFYDDLRC
jgi:hypothetical protein